MKIKPEDDDKVIVVETSGKSMILTLSPNQYGYGGAPGELLPNQVVKLFNDSFETDWVYDVEDDIYSYKSNLLVSLIGVGKGMYELSYGGRTVADVDMSDFGMEKKYAAVVTPRNLTVVRLRPYQD